MGPIRTLLLAGAAVLAATAPAFAALGDYFVDTAWLAANRDRVAVVDVRVAPKYYLGHVDGAVRMDKTEFLETRRGVKSLVPTVAGFEALMDRYGITPETTVVAYAEDDNPYAARLVWTLRYHGHERAYVLDGGYEKWFREGRPTEVLPTFPTPGSGYACRSHAEIRATAEDVLTHLGNPSAVVWDTRRPAEHEGSEVRADRGGHIPGSVHLNWTELLADAGGVKVLKDEAGLRALLASRGITPDREVIAHCQTGIRSSYATLVLLGLGYPGARNYDGSWIEWANDPSLPVDTGLEQARR